jgi:hypothetical protein
MYRLAIHITETLKDIIQPPNAFNVHNSVSLIHNLKEIHINDNIRLCSFHITNMYTNISIRELTNIIKNILHNNSTPETKKVRTNDIKKHNHKPQLLTVQQRIL